MKLLTKILKILALSILLLAVLVSILFGRQDIPLEALKEKYAQPPSSFIQVNDLNVHYRDEGNPNDSIPIVLIHGTGSSLHTFDAWTEQLKQDYRVIRMDLPAYGLTGPFPHRNYSMDNYSQFIQDFLVELGITKCIIGGNSLGGGIAWNYTVKYPDMVEKLILIDASGYPMTSTSVPIAFKMARIPVIKNIFTFITPRSVAKGSVENVYADKSKVTEELVDRYFELTLREGNRQAFVDRLSMPLESSDYSSISSIQQPTLVLWGDKDELITPESAFLFHEDLPNDTLVILNDVGHVPMEESPDESLEAVLKFLQASQ